MNYTAPPAFSLTSSLKKSISQMPLREHASPGPIYDLERSGSIKMKRTYSIGKAQRLALNHGLQHTPSPHHYQPHLPTKAPSITFTKAENSNPEADVPPVGAHYPSEEFTRPRLLTYSMGQKYPSIMTNNNFNPGPGSYQTADQSLPILTKSKNVKQNKFGSAKRFRYQINPNPGVGNYSIETTSKILNKKTNLPLAQKLKYVKQILPGPCEYLVKTQFFEKGEKGKSLSMRFKSPLQPRNDTTFAFAKYFENQQHLIALKSTPKFTIGKQKREQTSKQDLPGPTQYITDTYLPKNSFSTIMPQSERKEYNDTLQFPGPGSYQIKAQTGRKPSFGRSKSVAVVDSVPGPGRYEPVLLKRYSKGSRFGSQTKLVLKVEPSGSVGEYQITHGMQANKGSFSKSDRFVYKAERVPGPGDYQIHDVINYHLNPKHSISKKA